jgi:hypothetical protein
MKLIRHTYFVVPILFLFFVCAAPPVWAQSSDYHLLNLDFGGGFTPTLGTTSNNLGTGWNVTGGAGINIDRQFGVIGQVLYSELGVNNNVLKTFDVPGANAHLWGFTLDPIVRFHNSASDKLGFYLIGGPGYYERVLNFTRPTTAVVDIFDPFFGFITPVVVPANVTIGTITRVGWGGNIGAGVTYKVGYSGVKFFAEVRYHYVATGPRATEILPVTFGFRW